MSNADLVFLFIFVAGQLEQSSKTQRAQDFCGSSLQDGDLKTFRRRRESELKNGRVTMFATMGCYLPQHGRDIETMREDERG